MALAHPAAVACAPCTPWRRLKFHVVMFNLPLAPPPLSRAAGEGDDYDMPLIARRLAEVMDDVREETRCGFRVQGAESVVCRPLPPSPNSRTAYAVLGMNARTTCEEAEVFPKMHQRRVIALLAKTARFIPRR